MNVAVIDYGTGNLHSLVKAVTAGGATVTIVPGSDAELRTDAIVLPGVGAFGAAAARLAPVAAALRAAIADGVPCLGICLGMQLLFDGSDEGAGTGLGLLAGRVRRLQSKRLPHMGWNEVAMLADPLFAGLDTLVTYYANSFVVEPDDDAHVIGWTCYDALRFPAAVRHGNVWGVQFHPEKSGTPGLRLIRNFLAQVRP